MPMAAFQRLAIVGERRIERRAQRRDELGQRIGEVFVLAAPEAVPGHDDAAAEQRVVAVAAASAAHSFSESRPRNTAQPCASSSSPRRVQSSAATAASDDDSELSGFRRAGGRSHRGLALGNAVRRPSPRFRTTPPPDSCARPRAELDGAASARAHARSLAPQKPSMSSAVDDLLAILDLEPLEHNLFRGRSPQVGWQRVFGGQVIGQALVAALPHRRGPRSRIRCTPISCCPATPRCRSSTRSTASATAAASPPAAWSRSSTAQAIFSMSASFHVEEPGFDHQIADAGCAAARGAAERGRDQAAVPADDARAGAALLRARAADRAPAGRARALPVAASRRSRFNVWIRATGPLPDDPGDPPMRARLRLRHDAARHLARSPMAARSSSATIQAASLDHALWFHRPFRADDWLLYAQDSPSAVRRARLLPRR